MSQDTIPARVAKIIADQFGGLKASEVEPDMKLRDDLGADSIDAIQIAVALEKEFAVQIADDACADCDTVGELQQLMLKLQGEVA